MSSVYKKILRFSNKSENLIVIEMKIEKSDVNQVKSFMRNSFYVTDTETCFLEYLIETRSDQLLLHLHGIKRQNLLLGFLILLMDCDGVYLHSRKGTAETLKFSLGKNELLVGFGTKSGSLKYPISITCHLNTQNAEITANLDVELQCLRKLSADFKKSLDQATESDVTLNVDGVNIKANKVVLRARSPVFDKMFDHDTSEATKNVIDIKDIRAPVMEELLSFLYSGTKKYYDFEELFDLYYAADKYEVLSLRDACRSDLLNQLHVCNACQMLILANRHGDASFKQEIMKFIEQNIKSVVNTEIFEEVIKSDSNIALSLIRFLTNKL